MSENIKKEIAYKITSLQKIKGLKKHDDFWNLKELILSYHDIISILNHKPDIDTRRLTTVIETLEKKFTYFTNLTSQQTN